MGSSIENIRSEFLRILDEIEKVAKSGVDSSTYEPSNYESCIKIDGKPILPPLMTPEKKEQCSKWKQEAIQVEGKLAQKQDDQETSRQRRLSYTLEEPSPVLLAYMERFGKEENGQKQHEESCENPQCVLENYLDNLSKPPKIQSRVESPGKENVPPLKSSEEWSKESKDMPSPLKNDAPTWARSPRPEQTTEEPLSMATIDSSSRPEKIEEPSSMVTIESPPKPEKTEEPSSLVTVDSSLLESVSLPINSPRPLSSTRDKIEAAVSALALEQQRELKKLMEQQAKEREQLKKLFEEQQKALISSVLNAVSTTPNRTDTGVMADLDSPRTESTLTIVANNRANTTSPVIPTIKPKIVPSSLVLPEDYSLPEDAKTPVNECRFEKLSAIIKGHLTRRLIKTQKVQNIINSMKDITKMALQLHKESKQNLKLEDVQLHARLLQQRKRESESIHDIFFKYSIQQKMSIIRQDRDIEDYRRSRGLSNSPGENKQRRISAVTMAKIQQKQQLQKLAGSPQLKKLRRSSQHPSFSPRSVSSRRSLNFERAPSVSVSLRSALSSPRPKLGTTTKAKLRKTGVKPILHTKPWK